MDLNNLSGILLIISALIVLGLFFLILYMKRKRELHIFSLILTFLIFVWNFSLLLDLYSRPLFHYNGMLFINICFSAVGFVSVFVYFLGFAFASGHEIRKVNYLLLLLPVANAVAIWTNDLHHLYFVRFSRISSEIIRGPFCSTEAAYAYALLFFGLLFLVSFSIKNSGFFSKQSLLIVLGAVVPIIFDIIFIMNILPVSLYYEPISFTIAVFCFMLAILKFDFLSVTPIALQTVVDHMSDSYIVINVENDIIDFNKSILDKFDGKVSIKRRMNIFEWLDQIMIYTEGSSSFFQNQLKAAELNLEPASFDKQFSNDTFDKTFTIEITPLVTEKRHRGTIILFKDITEQRKSFELIQKAQAQLIESEHLVSLGQLVGGISHNLKTPIMSISGGLEGIRDLIKEYEESIGDPSVTQEDHMEIAKDMREWIDKMKSYCAYMSDIISTVKGQAVQLTASTTDKFILKELLKRIDILMNHELKSSSCKMVLDCRLDMQTEIKGEVNSLVQVINNLISNSIEAYAGNEGKIDFIISQKDNMVQFEVRDSGTGMSEDTKNRLFKEMITTKAKHGTGLGLYMSYSTIRGKFGGKMWFESEIGKGAVFYIEIPLVTHRII